MEEDVRVEEEGEKEKRRGIEYPNTQGKINIHIQTITQSANNRSYHNR